MRRSLRFQILAPTVLVMLAAFIAVAGAQTYLTVQSAERAIRERLVGVAKTLDKTSFPLSDAVLTQMAGLTGAEYAVSTESGLMLARSSEAVAPLENPSRVFSPGDIELETTALQSGEEYFAAVVLLQRRQGGRAPVLLHVYYPVDSWDQARRQAAVPTLIIGAVALLCQLLLVAAITQRVVSPLQRLTTQVGQIVEGDYDSIPPPKRNDEIRDLIIAVNQMSATLNDYEKRVRQNERLRTLGQLGGGVAHHLRNAATGCRMALDFHRAECPNPDEDNFAMAIQQLTVMESYLQRFLQVGKAGNLDAAEAVDATRAVSEVVELAQPTARHLQVALSMTAPKQPIIVHCAVEELTQAATNLLINAIEAAAESPDAASRRVELAMTFHDGVAHIDITDSGAGPPAGENIYEPLVSFKPDGSGLGLAVARSFAEHIGGELSHRRENDSTIFSLQLPATLASTANETAS